jgi:hypothetical protein
MDITAHNNARPMTVKFALIFEHATPAESREAPTEGQPSPDIDV